MPAPTGSRDSAARGSSVAPSEVGTRPGSPDLGAAAERAAVTFARILRGAGLVVPVGATVTYARALAAVGLEHRDDAYWAGRATLLRGPEDTALYDRAFRTFWDGTPSIVGDASPVPEELTIAFDAGGDDESDDADGDDTETDPSVRVRFSRAEVLRRRDFAEYTPDEHVEAKRMMADLRLVERDAPVPPYPTDRAPPRPHRPPAYRAPLAPLRW